jgi:imidazolonepropionase-like amidohydrolase
MIVKGFKFIAAVLFVYLALPNLLVAQQTLKNETQPLVLEQISVIDVEKGRIMPNFSVVITGERISALGKTGEVRIPKNARIIDASGKFLIPGLWDMHVHLSFYADTKERPFTAFPALITYGVTGVRDVGGDLRQIDKWRKEIAEGTLVGPRIFRAGPFVDGPKKMDETRAARTMVVNNAEEARAAVRKLKQLGVDFIKAHNGLSREAYLALVDECRKQKVLLATHLPTSVRIAEASDAGTNSIEHIEMLTESIFYGNPPDKNS